MPKGLRRRHGGGEGHFITCSCYCRLPLLGSARRREVFLKILEEVRGQFDFVVWGYVVMPQHFHLLITEPRAKSKGALSAKSLSQAESREWGTLFFVRDAKGEPPIQKPRRATETT